jgi:hypothetical protein
VAAGVFLATIGVVALLLTLGGGDSEDAQDRAEELPAVTGNPPAAPPTPSAELSIDMTARGRGESDGYAYFNLDDGDYSITVDMEIDDPPRGWIYELWLYNRRTDAISLGTGAPDNEGLLLITRNLPDVFTKYTYLDLSLEPERPDDLHSGRSLARGPLYEVTGGPPPP